MLGTKAAPLECAPPDDLPQIQPVVWMSSVEHHLHCGLCRRLDLEYSIGFVGPVNFAAQNVPTKAARVTQSLRLGKIHLAPPQRVLCPFSLSPVAGLAQRPLYRQRESR